MEPKDVLFFDKMLTPQLITIIYWILLVVVVLGGIGTMFVQSFIAGLIGIVVGLLFARIWCELLIVLFKMNDALQALKNRGAPGAEAGAEAGAEPGAQGV